MGISLWLVIGLVAGWLASKVLHSPHGILLNLVLGLVGSLVGGLHASALFRWSLGSITGSLVVAFVDAVIVLGLHRLLFSGHRMAHGCCAVRDSTVLRHLSRSAGMFLGLAIHKAQQA